MGTYVAKAADIAASNKKWYLIDAKGKTLGRLSTEVAKILMGKHKPEYTPNQDMGDFVIVINSDKIVVTGNKLEDKYKSHHTLYMGGLKQVQYKKLMAEKSDEALYLAIKGMLPKNALGRKMLKKVRIYKGAEHNHEAQQPEVLNLVKRYN